MSERLVFVDHDGTLTDSQREMGEYSGIVVEYNAKKLGLTESLSEKLLNAAKQQILKNPGEYGWRWGKERLIVAAATSDHYLFNQAATEILLAKLAEEKTTMRRKIDEIGGNEKYLSELFVECAPKLGVFYKPEAKNFLTELTKIKSPNQWAIVTNSDSTKVIKKLTSLDLGFDPKVIGGAKKYEVNRDWIGLLPKGPYKGFPGYPQRGIELQRQTFYNTLEKEAGEQITSMVFVEDVAEFVSWMDYLSENNEKWGEAKTALVLTPMTPEWEKNRYKGTYKNRFASENLLEILNWISNE